MSTPAKPAVPPNTDQLETRLNDDRLYELFTLHNTLDVLAVQDLDASEASAAMDVDVGSLSDPDYMQGRASAME
jgi:insulysin